MIGHILAVIFLYQISTAKADCDSLPKIANTVNNATGSGPYVTETIIRFDCDLGYNPAGTKREYRCSDTQWVDGDLRCEEIFCGHVETPENGKVVNEPSNQVGTTIQFECNEGYDMVATSNTMRCIVNGEWQPEEPPICKIKMCGEFGSIQYGSVFQDDSSSSVRNGYGSVTAVTCDENYIIKGNPRVMCKADGYWDTKPSCEESTCPLYPGLNSSCIKEVNPFDPFLFISCRNDVPVTKIGPDQAECSNGKWDTTEIACYCACKVDADLKTVILNNVGSKGYLSHDKTLDWKCKDKYDKNTADNLHCVDGNVIKPVCKAKPTNRPSTVTYKPVTDENRSTVNPPQTTTLVTDENRSTVNPPQTTTLVTDENRSTVNPPQTTTLVTDENRSTVNPPQTTTLVTDENRSTVNPPQTTTLVTDENRSTVNPPQTTTLVTDENRSTVNPPPTITLVTDEDGNTVNPPQTTTLVTDEDGNTVNPPQTTTLVTDEDGNTVNPPQTTTLVTDEDGNTVNPPQTTTLVIDEDGNTVNPPPTTTLVTDENRSTVNPPQTTTLVTDENRSTVNPPQTTTLVTDENRSTVNPPQTTTLVTDENRSTVNPPQTTTLVTDENRSTVNPPQTTTLVTDKNRSTENPPPTITLVTDEDGNTVNPPQTTTLVTDEDGNTVNPPQTTTLVTDEDGNTVNPPQTTTLVTDEDGNTVNPPQTTTLKPLSEENVAWLEIGLCLGFGLGYLFAVVVLLVCFCHQKSFLYIMFCTNENEKARKSQAYNCQSEKMMKVEGEAV